MLDKYSNNIILYYPPGAGGKFLMACLSLADNVAFPGTTSSQHQLYIDATQLEKFNMLDCALDHVETHWNDFLLTQKQFALGSRVNQYAYNVSLLSFLIDNIDKEYSINDLLVPESITTELADRDMYFLSSAHSIFYLYFFCQYWKGSTVINFKNPLNFAKYYRKNYIKTGFTEDGKYNKNDNCSVFRYVNDVRKKYNSVSGQSWPNFKTLLNNSVGSIGQFKHELETDYPDVAKDLTQMFYIIDFYKRLDNNSNTIDWNTDFYFDQQQTVKNIESIYKKLNLTNYNEELITRLYDKWILKLDQVKNSKPVESSECLSKLKHYVKINDFKTAYKFLGRLNDQ